MEICALLAAAGGVLAFWTIRRGQPVRDIVRSVVSPPCGDPCLGEEDPDGLRAAS
jgi:hypothetical protein